jgi:hypothetical protein
MVKKKEERKSSAPSDLQWERKSKQRKRIELLLVRFHCIKPRMPARLSGLQRQLAAGSRVRRAGPVLPPSLAGSGGCEDGEPDRSPASTLVGSRPPRAAGSPTPWSSPTTQGHPLWRPCWHLELDAGMLLCSHHLFVCIVVIDPVFHEVTTASRCEVQGRKKRSVKPPRIRTTHEPLNTRPTCSSVPGPNGGPRTDPGQHDDAAPSNRSECRECNSLITCLVEFGGVPSQTHNAQRTLNTQMCLNKQIHETTFASTIHSFWMVVYLNYKQCNHH